MADEANVVSLSFIAGSALATPFDTIEHAEAALDRFELAIEVARGVLARADGGDPRLVLSGARQVMTAAVSLSGLGDT